MIDLCLHFTVHQPWRLRPYRFSEVGRNHDYFDHERNAYFLRRSADRCYLPMNNIMLDLFTDLGADFRASYSLTTTFLEQAEEYSPEVIHSFKRLVDTKNAELLSTTSHFSFAATASPPEFEEQVARQQASCARLLTAPSSIFFSPRAALDGYSSSFVAKAIARLGFRGLLIEGNDRLLAWKSPHAMYALPTLPKLLCLASHQPLGEAIAWKFSDRTWEGWPLTTTGLRDKLLELNDAQATTPEQRIFVGLFINYDAFGEHNREQSGIFAFARELPRVLLDTGQIRFITPSQAFDTMEPRAQLSLSKSRRAPLSSISPIQEAATQSIYELEQAVKASGDPTMVETWRRLTSSDHFHYMATRQPGRRQNDLSPYESPYEAHIHYMNAIADLERQAGLVGLAGPGRRRKAADWESGARRGPGKVPA